MAWHPGERTALADALEAAGPGAPTCCDGWLSEHLAAHVALRDRGSPTAAGAAVPPLARHAAALTLRTGTEAVARGGYPELVAQVRSGPAPWSPMRWAGDAVHLQELFVHTEDVRRGRGRGAAAPRTLPAGAREALWETLIRVAPMLYRDSPVGVVLAWGHRDRRVRRPGSDPLADVVVRGDVGELVLHAWGRSAVADVELVGPSGPVGRLVRVRPG